MADTITVTKVREGLYEIGGTFSDETDPAEYFKRSDLYPPKRKATVPHSDMTVELKPHSDNR